MNIYSDYSNFSSAILSYRHYANKLHSNCQIPPIHIDQCLIEDFMSAHEESIKNKFNNSIKSQSIVLKNQLATPWQLETCPIIDSISLTIAITKTEAVELSKVIQKGLFSPNDFHYNKRKSKNKKRPYKFRLKIKSKINKDVHFFVDLIKNGTSENARHLRISFNPARTGDLFIFSFFKALKRTKLIDKLDERMRDANVTQLDIAMDLLSFQQPFLICETRQSIGDSFSAKDGHQQNVLQSVYYGTEERTHTIIYNKLIKYMSKGQRSLMIDGCFYIDITRIERVFKPQKGGRNIKLDEIGGCACFLEGHKFYDPIFLRYLPHKQIELIRQVGYLNAEKMHPELKDIRELHYLPINQEWFAEKQEEALLHLKRRILSACR